MNVQGGQYLDQAGSRVRRWTWPNSSSSSGPHIPLSPIFISLNQHVGVRILRQDRIIVSFLALGQQVKFNVGTKVQVFLEHSSKQSLSSGGCSPCRRVALPPAQWSCTCARCCTDQAGQPRHAAPSPLLWEKRSQAAPSCPALCHKRHPGSARETEP